MCPDPISQSFALGVHWPLPTHVVHVPEYPESLTESPSHGPFGIRDEDAIEPTNLNDELTNRRRETPPLPSYVRPIGMYPLYEASCPGPASPSKDSSSPPTGPICASATTAPTFPESPQMSPGNGSIPVKWSERPSDEKSYLFDPFRLPCLLTVETSAEEEPHLGSTARDAITATVP